MNKDLISRSALKKQLKKKQLKKKIYLDKDAEFERGYHFAINVCINLLNTLPTVEAYTKEDMKKDVPFNTERNRDIYIDRLYNRMQYKAISDKYGITRERCRQIYLKYKRLVDAGIIEE